MKRLIAMLIVAGMLVTTGFGCAGDSKDKDKKDKDKTTTPKDKDKDKDKNK